MAPPPPSAPSGSTPGAPGSPTDPNGAGSGMGGIASMAMSLVYPSLKQLFEASTRRITATVIFREGKQERSIEVVEWFTIPQKGLTVDDQSAQDTTGPASPVSTPKTNTKGTGR
jgi:general secretion pathway protein I